MGSQHFESEECKSIGNQKNTPSNYQNDYKAQSRERQSIFMKENVFVKWDFILLMKQTGNDALISFLSSL